MISRGTSSNIDLTNLDGFCTEPLSDLQNNLSNSLAPRNSAIDRADPALLADISYIPFLLRIREVLPQSINDFAVSYHGDALVVHVKHGRDLDRRTLNEFRQKLDALSTPELKVVFSFAPLRVPKDQGADEDLSDAPTALKSTAVQSAPRAVAERIIKEAAPEGVEIRRISRFKTEFGREVYQFAWVKAYVPPDVEYRDLREWSMRVEKQNGIGLIIAREPSFAQLNLNHSSLVEEDGLIKDPQKVEHRLRVIHGAPPPKNGNRALDHSLSEPLIDLTHLNFITIDSPGTMARDDALYAETLRDGTVHSIIAFADVTKGVPAGSSEDRYARRAGFTLYGRSRTLSMLPENLAYDQLSLNRGAERAVFAMELFVSPAGEVTRRNLFRAKLNVRDEFTFQGVGEQLPHLKNGSQEVLQSLWIGAHALRSGRAPKTTFMSIEKEGVWDTVVHEWMIAAKHHIAETLADSGVPILYRVYSPPGRSLRKLFMRRAITAGVEAKMSDFVRPDRFQDLLRRIQDHGHKHLYFDIIDTYLRRARYDVHNFGHHGLGFEAYTEIKGLRTYAGVINQRQAASALSGEPRVSFTELKRIQSQVNRKARTRDDNIYRLLVLEDLHEKLSCVGCSFSGTVNTVSANRITVTVEGFERHGIIHDRDMHSLSVTPGSRVDLKLSGFDPVRRKYVFSLDEPSQAA